jgi:hypothetical protein
MGGVRPAGGGSRPLPGLRPGSGPRRCIPHQQDCGRLPPRRRTIRPAGAALIERRLHRGLQPPTATSRE